MKLLFIVGGGIISIFQEKTRIEMLKFASLIKNTGDKFLTFPIIYLKVWNYQPCVNTHQTMPCKPFSSFRICTSNSNSALYVSQITHYSGRLSLSIDYEGVKNNVFFFTPALCKIVYLVCLI